MAKLFDVAEWFLHKESMTPKKLQKLCYYAQAWHLALLGKRLFRSDFQAWIHGPVIPALYSEYAAFGWNDIPKLKGNAPKFDNKTLEVLEAVYQTYSHLDGHQLEALTHSEQPWIEARGGISPLQPCNNKISVDVMRDYYKAKYDAYQND